MTFAAVTDAGPLIHLAEVDSLDLLLAFDELYVPETVLAEVRDGGVPSELSELSHELVVSEGSPGEALELDAGEHAALTIAESRETILLTDDLAAREAANERGVEVHGCIGVIVLGYARDRVTRDEAASLMYALQRETSLFITEAVVERGIELLDEASQSRR